MGAGDRVGEFSYDSSKEIPDQFVSFRRSPACTTVVGEVVLPSRQACSSLKSLSKRATLHGHASMKTEVCADSNCDRVQTRSEASDDKT